MELLILVIFDEATGVLKNLNSNMELLISAMIGVFSNIVNTFKFQYGATNISEEMKPILDTVLFKFQYGATNISCLYAQMKKEIEFKFQYGATNISVCNLSCE